MVLPPQYEEERRARVQDVPVAFKDVLSEVGVLDHYTLKVLNPPSHAEGWVGPTPQPSFEIWKGTRGKAVARIHPDGGTELMDETFSPLLDAIIAHANRAGKKAHDDWLAEYARLKAEDEKRR